MKHRWTILAACLFALAFALVLFNHDASTPADPASGVPQRRDSRPAATAQNTAGHPGSEAPAPGTHPPLGNDLPNVDGPSHSLTRQAASHDAPSRAELEIRAQAVEREANHELARLIPLLDLAPDQQQRVFQTLASTSPSFVPGMLVDGAAVKPPTANSQQSILAQLSDAQIAAYLQDSNESSAWWSEYLSRVTSQLQTGTPALDGATAAPTAATTPVETAPATKEAHAISGSE
ncbi:MAG: hypothetical protein WCK77_18100 [Verrucomicrobiota bacterium]